MSTISDVAKRAGVSIATVSRVINNSSLVSAKTAQRVNQAIEELSYSPTPAGQLLKSGKGKAIYIISAYAIASNPLVSSIQEAAKSRQLRTIILPYLNNPATFNPLSFASRAYGVICLAPASLDLTTSEAFAEKVPFSILVDSRFQEPPHSNILFVRNNLYQLNYAMAKYFFQSGVRRLVYPVIYDYHNKKVAPYSSDRMEGILCAAKACGIPLENLVAIPVKELPKEDILDGGISVGNLIADACLQLPSLPEAILCNTDMCAVGCIRRLRDHGIRVPDDIRVSGFDGSLIAKAYIPSITSFETPYKTVAEAIINGLIAQNTGHIHTPVPEEIPALIERESTAIVNAN